MQVSLAGAAVAHARSSSSISSLASSPIGTIIGALAQSTRLSLAEKRDFARAILAAAGDPAKLKKILMAIFKLEQQRKPGSYPPNTVAEVLEGLVPDSGSGADSGSGEAVDASASTTKLYA